MLVRTWLCCPRCGRDTPHDVRYAGTALRSATCVACRLETGPHGRPIGDYVSRFPRRLRSKPERMARELRGTPRLVLTLPRRIASKPARLGHEVIDVLS